MKQAVVLLCLILLMALYGKAQYNGSFRNLNTTITADSILLDTGTIVKSSILVYQGKELLQENTHYKINYFNGYFYPLTISRGSAVSISWQSLNINLKIRYSNKPRSLQLPQLYTNRYDQSYTPGNQSRFDLFKNDGLKLNGSISRGLGFGNNQDIVLNANLNLQMSGRINNDIDVLAAISDDNNPIQPEGNTQQLQDFDRVYVQLTREKTTLTVGDFEMVRPEGGYFMNYYKKSRGAQLSTQIKAGKNGTLKLQGEGALSRGRFARNIINGLEGNQGPYRLSGTNGELYIIVISGTEAVYLDGQKMTRGEQHDYVIDYNTGEITFMPRRPITQYSRIVVEFQFSDRNYARSVFHIGSVYEQKGYKIHVNYFTEQDNKNQPFLQDLDSNSKRILADVGDRLSEAVMGSAVKTTFDARKIMYRKTDTLAYSGVYVYAATAGNDSVFYEVTFSNVGSGKGNYRQSKSNANGRVYEWVAPINGIPQGDYEPVTLLISPKRRQMITVGTEINAIKNTTIQIEAANSYNDQNTFSTKDKANDAGHGLLASIKNKLPIGTGKWKLNTELRYEYVDQQFRYIERYRTVEFDRTWNRLLTNQNNNNDTGFQEHISSVRADLGNGASNLYYQLGSYNRQKGLAGLQHLAGFSLNKGKNQLFGEAELLNTSNKTATGSNSEVQRYRAEYNRILGRLQSGVKTEYERSFFTRNTDTLLTGSYGYQQYGVFIKNIDTGSVRYKAEYTQRVDLLPKFTELTSSTLGQNFNAGVDVLQQNGNRLSGNFTYREFSIRNGSITTLQPERTILARLEYDYGFLKRVFTANTYYQVGSGQELRRDFQYVEVAVGQGQYVWKDFNNDGTQQLNEFVLAGLTDRPQANYIRVFLPTNSFVSTHANQFNQTLNINPAAVWYNKTDWRKTLSRFSNQSALKTERKTTRLNTADFLNPFVFNINDTSLISLNALFRNTLFFNRSNPTFGADFTYQDQRSKTLLTNGFEARNRSERGINIRWNINSSWSLTSGFNTGQRIYSSDYFSENNYRYVFQEYKPRLAYQVSNQFRLTAIFSYFEGNNAEVYGKQKGTNRELGGELRYSLPRQGVMSAKLSQYQVSFTGNAQSQLGYDMLQGLVVGKNTVWNINFQQRLGNNLQITINYDGRSAENQRTVHIGRMEARYLF